MIIFTQEQSKRQNKAGLERRNDTERLLAMTRSGMVGFTAVATLPTAKKFPEHFAKVLRARVRTRRPPTAPVQFFRLAIVAPGKKGNADTAIGAPSFTSMHQPYDIGVPKISIQFSASALN